MRRHRSLRVRGTFLARVVVLATALVAAGCRTVHDHRDPTGERFPSVVGEALDGTPYGIPEDFAGAPVLLLVGYEMRTQFDVDRWLLGLRQAEIDVAVREVPTIEGWVPGLLSGVIDGGMREGIPDEDWGAVVTVYGDAEEITRFTGNRTGLPCRVLLLDRDGVVRFFHDEGYSVGALLSLREGLSGLAVGTR